mmetsp:Transcript_111759/g.356637  ORF Transcript_111759/g.356637 Transcript_111759/m.356637 type:complete len:220 (+) Transcript_111759:331-990(+)
MRCSGPPAASRSSATRTSPPAWPGRPAACTPATCAASSGTSLGRTRRLACSGISADTWRGVRMAASFCGVWSAATRAGTWTCSKPACPRVPSRRRRQWLPRGRRSPRRRGATRACCWAWLQLVPWRSPPRPSGCLRQGSEAAGPSHEGGWPLLRAAQEHKHRMRPRTLGRPWWRRSPQEHRALGPRAGAPRLRRVQRGAGASCKSACSPRRRLPRQHHV